MKRRLWDDLTKSTLEALYIGENLTEQEIAVRFNTYQVQVNRLRKKYGIPTKTKSDRYDLPEMTQRQKMLLLGSMLGDGHLFNTGSVTAAYSEHHSDAQREYLEWKVKEWGPFIASVRPNSKVVEGKEYPGSVFRLKGCQHFRHYYEMFYPEGSGNKTFVNLPLSNLTGFAVAVWYMDDGSRTSGGYARLSVGPRPEDQEVLLQVLLKFGIKGHLYHSNGDHELQIHDRTNLTKFVDLVSKYVPPCMAHKLELDPRTLGAAPRDKLTSDSLRSFLDRGLTPSGIAKLMGVGVTTVRKAMVRTGCDPRPKGRPKRSLTTSRLSVQEAEQVLKNACNPSEEQVFDVLQRTEFPERKPSDTEIARDWELLRLCDTRVEGGVVVGKPKAGIVLCDQFFGHRFDASYEQLPSVRRAWYDPKWIRRAIQFQVRVGDPLLPWNVYRALRGIVRNPSNFRPGVAKAVVDAFCASGGVVLDPCAGYGGRAAGTLASGRSYVGVDPHPNAGLAFKNLFEFVGASDRASFHNLPFEDVNLGSLRADMVFTSPPYFSTERYSDDACQSWIRYKTWDAWRVQFLTSLVQKAFDHLEPGCVFCLNLADTSKKKYPLVSSSIALASRVGFHHEQTISMPLGRFGTSERSEPILVFRKPR
jgi:hypothetical protein